MSILTQSKDVERAILTAAKAILGGSAVESIRVNPIEDHTGEPSLSVLIRLRDGEIRPSGADFIRLVKAMRDALEDADDARFPYLSFSAPGDEQAEDTRKTA